MSQLLIKRHLIEHRMATKLFRLVNDKKKSVNTNLSGKPFRDIQTEEYVADLEAKLSDLDMINKRLKENVVFILFKQRSFKNKYRLAVIKKIAIFSQEIGLILKN